MRQIEKWHTETSPEKKQEIETNPLKIFLTALENCKPLVKVQRINKGGINYQVPVPITEKEKEFKAMKYIIETCREKEKTVKFHDRLASELLDDSRSEVLHIWSYNLT